MYYNYSMYFALRIMSSKMKKGGNSNLQFYVISSFNIYFKHKKSLPLLCSFDQVQYKMVINSTARQFLTAWTIHKMIDLTACVNINKYLLFPL